jgi:heterotetrameric sarcosine oxidase delta subunit
MLRIRCPWCGERDETEFRYRGDASVSRPPADGALVEFNAYVYQRENPRGWHLEWWLHTGGCRKLLQVLRHTMTHEIRWVGGAQEKPPPSDAGPDARKSAR